MFEEGGTFSYATLALQPDAVLSVSQCTDMWHFSWRHPVCPPNTRTIVRRVRKIETRDDQLSHVCVAPWNNHTQSDCIWKDFHEILYFRIFL